jgi:hypothetical protein
VSVVEYQPALVTGLGVDHPAAVVAALDTAAVSESTRRVSVRRRSRVCWVVIRGSRSESARNDEWPALDSVGVRALAAERVALGTAHDVAENVEHDRVSALALWSVDVHDAVLANGDFYVGTTAGFLSASFVRLHGLFGFRRDNPASGGCTPGAFLPNERARGHRSVSNYPYVTGDVKTTYSPPTASLFGLIRCVERVMPATCVGTGMAKPGPAPKVTPEDVLDVFAGRDDPTEPLTAPEIAEELGCSRSTALDKLTTLGERGDVRSKKVGGRSRVWWIPPSDEDRDVLAGFGSWTGSGLSAAVEETREELDENLREDGRALS